MSYQESIKKFFQCVSHPDASYPYELFKGFQNTAIENRLNIYKKNIYGAFNDALSSAYPITKYYIGNSTWQELLFTHNDSFNTGMADLNIFGQHLPTWLTNLMPASKTLQDIPFIIELATLEWYIHQAQFVKDDPEFANDEFIILNSTPADSIRLIPSKVLYLQKSFYPLDSIWKNKNSKVKPILEERKDDVYAVFRESRFEISVACLTHIEAEILTSALNQSSLEEIIGQTNLDPDTTARTIFNLFERRLLVAIKPI